MNTHSETARRCNQSKLWFQKHLERASQTHQSTIIVGRLISWPLGGSGLPQRTMTTALPCKESEVIDSRKAHPCIATATASRTPFYHPLPPPPPSRCCLPPCPPLLPPCRPPLPQPLHRPPAPRTSPRPPHPPASASWRYACSCAAPTRSLHAAGQQCPAGFDTCRNIGRQRLGDESSGITVTGL